MPCWTEYGHYCVAVTATGAALLALPPEVYSGHATKASLPAIEHMLAAAYASVEAGTAYAECMSRENMDEEAARMREHLDQLMGEITYFQQVLAAGAF